MFMRMFLAFSAVNRKQEIVNLRQVVTFSCVTPSACWEKPEATVALEILSSAWNIYAIGKNIMDVEQIVISLVLWR